MVNKLKDLEEISRFSSSDVPNVVDTSAKKAGNIIDCEWRDPTTGEIWTGWVPC